MVSNSELEKRMKQAKNFYCGDKTKLPKEYWRFGSRRECMSRGVGIGMYVVPKQKEKQDEERLEYKRKKEREERYNNRIRGLSDLYREEEKDFKRKEKIEDSLRNKNEYKKFIEKNFNRVKRNLSPTNLENGDVFKILASMWKREMKSIFKDIKERQKLREREKSRSRRSRRRSNRNQRRSKSRKRSRSR